MTELKLTGYREGIGGRGVWKRRKYIKGRWRTLNGYPTAQSSAPEGPIQRLRSWPSRLLFGGLINLKY